MATNNFHNKNASKIYAVLMNREQPILDDEGNETDETEYVYADEWECEDLLSNVKSEMETLAKKHKTISFHKGGNADFLRSFDGSIIGSFWASKDYLGIDCEVEVAAVLRSGYYEGANLDFEITYKVNGYDYEDYMAEWEYSANNNHKKGLVNIQYNNVSNWFENTADTLINELESIFENFTEIKLVKQGQFSNGEAIYSKIS
jgi:hypothetical protein